VLLTCLQGRCDFFKGGDICEVPSFWDSSQYSGTAAHWKKKGNWYGFYRLVLPALGGRRIKAVQVIIHNQSESPMEITAEPLKKLKS
jgi:hypothetical protein